MVFVLLNENAVTSFSVPNSPVSLLDLAALPVLATAGSRGENALQEEQVSGSFFDLPSLTAVPGEEVGTACSPCPTSHTGLHLAVHLARLLPGHSDHHNPFPLAPCGR